MDKSRSKTHRRTRSIAASPSILPPDRFDAKSRERLGSPALRTFVAIAEQWGLSEAQRLNILGLPGRSTYHLWLAKARDKKPVLLPLDALLRLSAVFGIYKNLNILLSRPQEQAAWLKNPNDATVFGGQPPLALITNGTQDGILLVRRYLDAWRGGVFAAPNSVDQNFVPYVDEDIVIA